VGVGGGDGGGEELHLLDKPFPTASSEEEDESQPEPAPAPSTEQVLASYLNFFQLKGADASEDTESNPNAAVTFQDDGSGAVVYYDPKPGDLVVGVVVGGDARVLDVDVGAGGEPALMLAKEAAPTSPDEFGYLACDLASTEFAAEGRVGVAVGGADVGGKVRRAGKGKCAPVVGVGTVVFAEVLGRTLGGRPLLSARRLFRRVAWHRVRQVLYASPLYFRWNSMNWSISNRLIANCMF
jgi:small subunit ribosomal protein S1